MTLRVTCKCGSQLKLTPAHADKVIKCPSCARKFRVPAAKFAAAAQKRASAPVGHRADEPSRRPTKAEAKQQIIAEASSINILNEDQADPTPASLDDDLLRGMSEGAAVEEDALSREFGLAPDAPSLPAGSAGHGGSSGAPARLGGPTCPACSRTLLPGAKICVQCGINIQTGRSLMTTEEGHLDSVYIAAENTISIISWIFWTGVYPIASEGFGTKKPWVVRGVAILTILTSIWFWCYDWTDSPGMRSAKNLLLWGGNKPPNADLIYAMYQYSNFGNPEAFQEKLEAISEKESSGESGTGKQRSETKSNADTNDADSSDEEDSISDEDGDGETGDDESVMDEEDSFEDEEEYELTDNKIMQAYRELSPRDRPLGEFRVYQLLTNAFLHGDIMHLAGNLLFLMVFGARVNALIGNIKAAVLYPLLAILASIGHLISVSDDMPNAALGASGAIMGLAGMYFIIFPVHKVHMVAWWRWGFVRMFKLSYKTFAVRGFWVVLFYIAFDVIATLLGAEDGVAHWAHLSGFGFGAGIALILLVSRQINARGTDLLSALFGRHAWAIIGKPRA